MHYRAADVWHERMLLVDMEVDDADVWMVLTPDMDVYAEDMNDNLGVRLCAAGNAVPRTIGRGQAYRIDGAFPTDGEYEAYVELAEDHQVGELARMMAGRPILRSTGARGPRAAAPAPGPGGALPGGDEEDDDAGEEEEEEEEEEKGGEGAPPSGSSSTERRRVFSLGGPHDYGDEVKLPASATKMPGDKAAMFLVDGVPVAAKKVRDDELDDFMALVSRQDARIMPIVRGRTGRRHRTWQRIGEDSEEVDMDDWPLSGSRTASWCIDYLVKMGQTIEGHHEDFTRRCKLERNSWGVQAHWQATNFLRFLAEVDQCDICNLVSAEAMFREIQTIEYSYQDKMRDLEGGGGGGGGGAGRLTSEEQAMFAGTARLSSTLMICPLLLDQVKAEVDREGGLLKNLVKSREARAALRKK